MILKTILYSPIKQAQVLRTAPFCVITQRLAVTSYRTFGDDPSVSPAWVKIRCVTHSSAAVIYLAAKG